MKCPQCGSGKDTTSVVRRVETAIAMRGMVPTVGRYPEYRERRRCVDCDHERD